MAASKLWALATLGWVFLGASCGTPNAQADARLLEPGVYDPYTAATVADYLETQHYLRRPIDDEVSARWLREYLDTLDPDHSIFLAADIEAFLRYEHGLDDDVHGVRARLAVPFEIFEIYRERLATRLDAARAQLSLPVDFTIDEAVELDRSKAPWPQTVEDADEIWRLRIKDELLAAQIAELDRQAGKGGEPGAGAAATSPGAAAGAEAAASESLLDKRVTQLRRRYDSMERIYIHDAEALDVLEYWLSALMSTYDPHSTYFKPATSENFDIELSNSVEGIGAVLTQDDEWYTEIRDLVVGGPAARGGELKQGDKILAVAQEDGEPVDVVGQRLDNVVKLIRGPKGTDVILTVVPAEAGGDTSVTREITITRDKVELSDRLANAEVKVVEQDGATYRIGLVTLPEFYQPRGDDDGAHAAEDVQRLIEALERQGIDALALDLRYNGGGSLPEAIALAGEFIPRGPIVQVHDAARDQVDSMHDPDPGIVWEGPLVVLTNQGSASASEIVAGAVQDYGRGLVIGASQTHGKGTVQTLYDLARSVATRAQRRMTEDEAGAVKLTTQRFYRISGASTQAAGVVSDVVLPSPLDGREVLETDLENAMPYDDIAPTRYTRVGDAARFAPALQERADARIASQEDFQRFKAQVALLQEKRDTLSLRIDERRAEIARRRAILGIDDDEVGDEADEDGAKPTPPTPPADAPPYTGRFLPDGRPHIDPFVGTRPDPVLDEALRVTADYVKAIRDGASPPPAAQKPAKRETPLTKQ